MFQPAWLQKVERTVQEKLGVTASTAYKSDLFNNLSVCPVATFAEGFSDFYSKIFSEICLECPLQSSLDWKRFLLVTEGKRFTQGWIGRYAAVPPRSYIWQETHAASLHPSPCPTHGVWHTSGNLWSSRYCSKTWYLAEYQITTRVAPLNQWVNSSICFIVSSELTLMVIY